MKNSSVKVGKFSHTGLEFFCTGHENLPNLLEKPFANNIKYVNLFCYVLCFD